MVKREKTCKQYFCSRCNKEITTKGSVFVFSATRIRRYDDGSIRPANVFSYENDINDCLCSKCLQEYQLFIDKKYPFESSEREKILEKRIEDMSTVFCEDMYLISEYSKLLSGYIDTTCGYMAKHPLVNTDLLGNEIKNEIKRITGNETKE